VSNTDTGEKKESPPNSDHSAKGERKFFPIIQKASLRYNIDPALVKAIIRVESEQNIHAGVRHFRFLLKQFDGDVKLALAAYNAGSRHVKRYNAIPPFKETKRYLKKVFRYYDFYK
jgi:soluble lytic murein transglycosylase-like protein